MLMIDRNFASEIDDYMIAADLKTERAPPAGILDRVNVPLVTPLLKGLQNASPIAAALVLDLYDLSSGSLKNISKSIKVARKHVKKGKALKAFSILTTNGGLTYAVVDRVDDNTRDAARAIGEKHKYDNRRDRWYVILDNERTSTPIDALLPLVFPWIESSAMAAQSRMTGEAFKSRQIRFGHQQPTDSK